MRLVASSAVSTGLPETTQQHQAFGLLLGLHNESSLVHCASSLFCPRQCNRSFHQHFSITICCFIELMKIQKALENFWVYCIHILFVLTILFIIICLFIFVCFTFTP